MAPFVAGASAVPAAADGVSSPRAGPGPAPSTTQTTAAVTQALAARGKSLPSPKPAETARLLRCSSVKYGEYSPSSRLAAGPAAPISARSDFRHGLLVARAQTQSSVTPTVPSADR